MNSRLLLVGLIGWACSGSAYAQWSITENDALSTADDERQSSYIIKKGDTLWDLAFQFLGDPFNWPELWHANEYIKNPNLIYPGNSLIIPVRGKNRGKAVSSPPESESMTSLSSSASDDAENENGSRIWGISEKEAAEENLERFTDSLVNIQALQNDFFTSDLLERAGFLWFDKDEKGLIYPGNAAIAKTDGNDPLKKESKNIYRQFDEISISIFKKNTFKQGDTVDVYHSDRFVKFKGKTANIVRRIGRARITGVSGDHATAVLYRVWDIISEGDRIDTLTHFPNREIDTLIDRDVLIRGTVFERIEATESPYLFHTIICDRGTQDGVQFGDLFLIYPHGSMKTSGSPSALGCAIHVGTQSSTLVLEKLFDINVAPGDTLELVKRIRLK